MARPPSAIDPFWTRLKAATQARIGLQRTGAAIATPDHLAFQLAHAEARDAVAETIDAQGIAAEVQRRGQAAIVLHSAAADRASYLARPDLGRALDAASRVRLTGLPQVHDLVFVIADGLSARAINRHALPLLDQVLPDFSRNGWKVGPLAVVEQGRVAIGDEIGEALRAALVVVLIGERPGLSSPDSLGIYLTFAPHVGRTDAERNCLSNIRSEGMSYSEAARRLLFLCSQAGRRQLTGVQLKDETVSVVNGSKMPPSGA